MGYVRSKLFAELTELPLSLAFHTSDSLYSWDTVYRLSRDEGPEFGHGSGLTRPADILLYGWRGDHHYCVDLIGVSPARGDWWDAASALTSVEQSKRTSTRRRVLVTASISYP